MNSSGSRFLQPDWACFVFLLLFFLFLISPGSSLHWATDESHILLTHIYLSTNIVANGELPLGCCDAQGAQEYCFSHFKCEHLQIRYTTCSQTHLCVRLCVTAHLTPLGWGGRWGWGGGAALVNTVQRLSDWQKIRQSRRLLLQQWSIMAKLIQIKQLNPSETSWATAFRWWLWSCNIVIQERMQTYWELIELMKITCLFSVWRWSESKIE